MTERPYYIGKNKIYSPDVMLYKDDKCVLFDSKSSVPKLLIREFDDYSINETTHRCAYNIKQMYNRLNEFKYYNPFDIKFKRENIFGVVVLLEDNYIPRDKIYLEAINLTKINDNKIEKDFMQSNIKIIGLDEIESYTYRNKNFIDALVINRDKVDGANWTDITMLNYKVGKANNKGHILLKEFIIELRENMHKLMDEMNDKGILN